MSTRQCGATWDNLRASGTKESRKLIGTVTASHCLRENEPSTMKKSTILPRKTPPSSSRIKASHEGISALAATLWEQRGRPEGHDLEIWLEAERILSSAGTGAAMEAASEELDALFPGNSGPATTSL
jgi:hypothetical protein